jgi:4-amino-4-deoxy-L-arabinose transferase-like glycosyltransferase
MIVDAGSETRINVPTGATGFDEKAERMWLIAIGLPMVIQLWVGMLSSSLWLDETASWWITRDGFVEATERALSWSGVSPLYFWTVWLSTRLFGHGEVALRLPSIIAMAAATYFLYRVAERIYDRATAGIVALIFICISAFYAVDARPYALAMLGLTASTWALFRWLDSERMVYIFVYSCMAAMTVYAHCIMALGLAPAALYAIAVLVKSKPKRLAWLGACLALIGVLSLPLVQELRTFYSARSAHTFAGIPPIGQIVEGFFPGSLVGIVIAGVWAFRVFRGDGLLKDRCSSASACFIWGWAVWAPGVMLLLLFLSDLRLFVPRYLSSSMPAQALLLGGLVSSIRSDGVRKFLLIALAGTAIFTEGKLAFVSHGNENWPVVMQTVRQEAGEESPVLLVGGFVESKSFAVIHDPKLREVLFAPELEYGEPKRSVHIPISMKREDMGEFDRLAEKLRVEKKFFVVTENFDRSYEMWLLGKLGADWRAEEVSGRFGGVLVLRFLRVDGTAEGGS